MSRDQRKLLNVFQAIALRIYEDGKKKEQKKEKNIDSDQQ